MSAALIAHAAATWVMVGVIWFVQVVHYPLFERAERGGFTRFALDHQRLTTYVVFPPMLLELATGVLLALRPASGRAGWAEWAGLGLIGVNWLSTFFVQVPLHAALAQTGYDPDVAGRLVASNWVRTAAWSLRGGLVAWMLARA